MRVHLVDVQAGIVLVAHAAVKSRFLELLALEKGLDRTFEFTALFHPTPLLLQRLVKKQLNGWGAVDARLFGNVLIGFDVDFDALSLSIQF